MQILKYPHPILRHKCKPIKKIDQELRDVIAEMIETMYAGDGVGLAANQVGLPLQIFVLNTSGDKNKPEEEYVFINPVITKKFGGFTESEEGCLSFPEIHAVVERPAEVVLQGAALDGSLQQFRWKGLAARAVQHEFDHLQGKAFIDRLLPVRRLEIRGDLEALEREFETNRQLGVIPSDHQIAVTLAEWEQKWCTP
ncbi:MAG: peptide deformylase [Planctomycetaceae bacterium]|nr:peptide deformylase [Planctomycetaceae bacterium]